MAEKKKRISRRKFLVRGGLGTVGVLAVGTYLFRSPIRRAMADAINTADAPYVGNTSTPVIWFEVTSDNEIIIHSPKVEMGQGTFTGLAQMAADELDVSMDQIKVVHANSISGNMDGFATGGSTSISSLWIPLRELAATMREMIKKEAAAKMGISPSDASTENGVVSAGGKTMTYAEAAKDITEWDVPDTPTLKNVSDYKFVGKAVPRVDLKDKVFGAPIFGMDATMPDMLYGAVVRPNAIGATYTGADISKAQGMPGVVKIVQEKDFVGVVANSLVEAENAKNVIDAKWEVGRNWQTADIEAMIAVGQGEPFVIQKEGDAADMLDTEDGIITAEYKSPIGAHAQLEPNGALAYVEADKATIMISTQVVKITRDEIAKRLDLDDDQVNIVPTFLGGGFGRRLHTPNAVQAAVLSKAVGKPVKCFFTRKEEFQNDTFRPPTHHVLKAKLNINGMIEALEHNVSSGDVAFGSPMVPGIAAPLLGADLGAWRGGMIQYGGIPNYRAVSWRQKLPFATSWWRSLGLLANTFAIESFIDELAVTAEKDPVEFRLAQIQDDDRGFRLKEVIKVAAEKSGYKDEVVNGRAMGFAASTDANTPCAQVVELSIENNEIKVHKVTCAMDPGLVVNPDQVRAQCEGAIIMGMSAALFEKMDVEDGQLTPTIYGPYQMALMKHAPKEINVVLLQNSDTPGAVGEPPLGPIGAAIANAVFRLTKERLRSMPLTLT
ncbi:xanthine dehydrogenase family protein molybdopterin-binding subunit [Aggregatimonas sangjinii]|uniref:Xanthine dehydrogenase family protein molybdopterin-binding subunit n=1 Tax=Aggregatimonas sangjinii TaxID=2583587 RepID=A0A5B7SNW5_9FLAO|nr:molybdopterin cofactor-binding domain-containing protein [Aggregatimonas sangjinii]QCW98692.1 xanthine dehydrogenase family protein molybdopterin-binding subunit [Aggregatimonas sangjinii]